MLFRAFHINSIKGTSIDVLIFWSAIDDIILIDVLYAAHLIHMELAQVLQARKVDATEKGNSLTLCLTTTNQKRLPFCVSIQLVNMCRHIIFFS